MPPNRASTRQKQTRLAFTPLPSSSPAAAKYPGQIQDRAAAVRYNDPSTPSKRRRLSGHLRDGIMNNPTDTPDTESPGGRVNFAVMVNSPAPSTGPKKAHRGSSEVKLPPSPAASSQVELGRSIQDPEVQLTTSDSDSENPPHRQVTINPFSIRKDKYAKDLGTEVRFSGTKRITGARSASAEGNTSGTTTSRPYDYRSKELARTSSESDDLPILSGRKRNGAAVTIVVSSGDESDVDQIRLTSPRPNAKRVDVVDEDSHNRLQSRPIPSLLVNTRAFLLGGSTGNAPVSRLRLRKVVTPTKPSKTSTQPTARRRTRSSGKAEQAASPTKRLTRSSTAIKLYPKAAPVTLNGERNDGILDSDDDESDDGALRPSETRTTAAQTSTIPVVIASEESEEELVSSLKKRRRRIRSNEASSAPATGDDMKQQEDDLEEDLEDLQATEVRTDRTRVRGPNSKRSAAQKQLELLKRRRAGDKVFELSDSEGNQAPPRGIYDSDSQARNISEAHDEISEEDNDSGTDYIRQSLGLAADKYDKDFIDDDADDSLGAPHGLEEIPLQFTRHAHKKPREHFKDAVEWMVHNKLDPAFSRNDPVYKNAFYKLDDVVKGYSSSKFVSAAWTSEFSKALKARPEFEEVQVPTMFGHKCDACNRSGHPAKYQITLSGRAYHRESLEDISEDEDDNEDDDDAKSHNSQGFSIPSKDLQYFVGRFCRANAQTAHALTHWRYHLNQWVLDWLKNAGHTEPLKIIERENWSKKRRREFANEVVDGMEGDGEIQALYRDFKINLEIARDAKPSRYGDRDDDGV